MTLDKEHEFKKKAFGYIKKFEPTKKILGNPLKSGALKLFCTTCGHYAEFKHETVEQLKELINDFPHDPENYFVEYTTCILCKSPHKEAKLRKISDLP